MRRAAALTVLVLWGFLLLAGCDGAQQGACPARVDRVEPAIPGLLVEGTRGITGELKVVNNTGQDVYLYDQEGQEQYKITATESFDKDSQGNWVHLGNGNWMAYHEETIKCRGSEFDALPGRYSGEVMKEWVIAGRAGDTPFTIYGRTVYEPLE